MMRERFEQYLFRRPALIDCLKSFFSHRLLVNNRLYQKYVLRLALNYAKRYPHEYKSLTIETTLSCNTKCIMCAHHYRDMHGVMSMELFKKIIDDCYESSIKDVGLSVYGEPLVDPYLFERIQYLRKYNMGYGLFTNGQLLDHNKAHIIFKMGGLRRINFSVLGYKREVYEAIMPGLKRDLTYKNILDFLCLREQYKRQDLEVIISTVKLNLNKQDLKYFIKYWQRQNGVSQIITADLWDRLGGGNLDLIGGRTGCHKRNIWLAPCKLLWREYSIYFDGKVAPCCGNADGRELIIGDMNTQTLNQIYGSNILLNLKKQHLENRRSLHPICGKCLYNSVWF